MSNRVCGHADELLDLFERFDLEQACDSGKQFSLLGPVRERLVPAGDVAVDYSGAEAVANFLASAAQT